jgi:response regulator RpfG family c-di-GMP phosphodiesterase
MIDSIEGARGNSMTETADGQTMTLLFVDDEPSILSSLRRLFRPHGYRILTAESGKLGLETLEKEQVDLVISDMRMPEMDGAHFLEKVRERWPQVVRLLLTGYADVGSTVAAINRGEIYRYISKPWEDNDIVLTVREALEHQRLASENARLLALTRSQNDELKALNAGLEQKVAERTAQVQQALHDLKRGFVNTVNVFGGLIELRSGKLAGHGRRVAEHARIVAARLGMNEAAVQDVVLAALLHDIGKIGLADDLLDKPFNALSAEARAELMKHAAKGQAVLMGIEQLKGAGLLVRHHHECFDGSGYPDGLTGLAIPLGARILAVVNEYDALQLGTLVNRSLRPQEALAFIVENRGKRYDPGVVDAYSAWLSQTSREELTEVPMRPGSIKAGMILARDLVHRDGYLLLAKGQVLAAEVIAQLTKLETTEGMTLTLFVRQEAK